MARSGVKGDEVAERRVRFYEMVNARRERLPAPLDFDGLRDDVRALGDTDAYVQLSRMEVLGSAYDPLVPGARRQTPLLALDRITRDVRLRIERRRNYRPLTLADDETLAEPTFYALFPDNVLAVMRNSGVAPGPSSFRDYVNKLELFSEPIEISPLVDTNALRALADVETLTKFDVAIGADVAPEVFANSSPTLFETMRLVRQRIGNATIEVLIKVSPKGHTHESQAVFEEVRALQRSEAINHVDRAVIGYRSMEDGRAATYDFLDEAIVTETQVELSDDTSQPTEPSVAEAMAGAYDEMWEDIRSALQRLS